MFIIYVYLVRFYTVMLYSSPIISKLLPIYGNFYRPEVLFVSPKKVPCIIRPDFFSVYIIAFNHQRSNLYCKRHEALLKANSVITCS